MAPREQARRERRYARRKRWLDLVFIVVPALLGVLIAQVVVVFLP